MGRLDKLIKLGLEEQTKRDKSENRDQAKMHNAAMTLIYDTYQLIRTVDPYMRVEEKIRNATRLRGFLESRQDAFREEAIANRDERQAQAIYLYCIVQLMKGIIYGETRPRA